MTETIDGEDRQARIEAIRQRLKAATAGPWEVAPRSDNDEVANVVAGYKEIEENGRTIKQAHWIAELDASLDFESDREAELDELSANASLIAHAPTDLAFLLSEVDRLAPSSGMNSRQIAETIVSDYEAQRANDISDEERVQHVEYLVRRHAPPLSSGMTPAQEKTTSLRDRAEQLLEDDINTACAPSSSPTPASRPKQEPTT